MIEKHLLHKADMSSRSLGSSIVPRTLGASSFPTLSIYTLTFFIPFSLFFHHTDRNPSPRTSFSYNKLPKKNYGNH